MNNKDGQNWVSAPKNTSQFFQLEDGLVRWGNAEQAKMCHVSRLV